MDGSWTVTETREGWSVVAAGVVLRTFETNAAAWRWIDRQEGSPISPSRGGVGLDREQRDHANRRRRGPGPTKGGKLPLLG